MFNAAQALKDEPVEFWIGRCRSWFRSHSGVSELTVVLAKSPQRGRGLLSARRNLYCANDVRWICHYALEARAHGLPVIASKNCGKVVQNGVNGSILDETSAACIVHAVRDCIASPDRLEKLASASRVRDKFTIEALANQLQRLGATL